MPDKRDQSVKARARADKSAGKSASTQAGEFMRDEIDRVREGQHGVRNTKQAIAIGLSKARRAGVDLPPPKAGRAKASTRKKAGGDSARGHSTPSTRKPSAKRSRATVKALKREGKSVVSSAALSRHAKSAAKKR